jgi:hypothetical protein
VFDSTQLYKLNSGLRKLDGHIDTNLIEEVLDSIACAGDDVLDTKQLEILGNTTSPEISIDTIVNGEIRKTVNVFIKKQCECVESLHIPDGLKFKHYCSILSIAMNWRSFLLGADGQGVEHSDTTVEFVRMMFMLAYQLSDTVEQITASWLNVFADFIRDISMEYWKDTIGPVEFPKDIANIYHIERFQGFKARNSVVLVKATRIPQQS